MCVIGVMYVPGVNASSDFSLEMPTPPAGFVMNPNWTITRCDATPTNNNGAPSGSVTPVDRGLYFSCLYVFSEFWV